MKRLRILWVVVFMMTMTTAVAQEIGEVVDSVKSGLKASSVKEAVSKVQDSFKVKKAEADSLIGKWVYDGPAVYATKGNLLLKLVENTTTKQLEKLLDDYMEKIRKFSEQAEDMFGLYIDTIHLERDNCMYWKVDMKTSGCKKPKEETELNP